MSAILDYVSPDCQEERVVGSVSFDQRLRRVTGWLQRRLLGDACPLPRRRSRAAAQRVGKQAAAVGDGHLHVFQIEPGRAPTTLPSAGSADIEVPTTVWKVDVDPGAPARSKVEDIFSVPKRHGNLIASTWSRGHCWPVGAPIFLRTAAESVALFPHAYLTSVLVLTCLLLDSLFLHAQLEIHLVLKGTLLLRDKLTVLVGVHPGLYAFALGPLALLLVVDPTSHHWPHTVHSPHQSHQKGSPRDRRCSIVARTRSLSPPMSMAATGGRAEIRSEYFKRRLLAETRFQLFAMSVDPSFELGYLCVASDEFPKLREEGVLRTHSSVTQTRPSVISHRLPQKTLEWLYSVKLSSSSAGSSVHRAARAGAPRATGHSAAAGSSRTSTTFR